MLGFNMPLLKDEMESCIEQAILDSVLLLLESVKIGKKFENAS